MSIGPLTGCLIFPSTVYGRCTRISPGSPVAASPRYICYRDRIQTMTFELRIQRGTRWTCGRTPSFHNTLNRKRLFRLRNVLSSASSNWTIYTHLEYYVGFDNPAHFSTSRQESESEVLPVSFEVCHCCRFRRTFSTILSNSLFNVARDCQHIQ